MQTSLFTLVSLLGVLSLCNAFSSVSMNKVTHHRAKLLFTSTSNNNDANLVKIEKSPSMNKVAGFATALILGWGVATGACVAATPALDYSLSGSSVIVAAAAEFKDSDIADFSLPTYGDLLSAEKNSNLKGTKTLLADEYMKAGSVSAPKAEAVVVSAKDAKVAEASAKDAKAARRAEMKAAREKQMAEAEAALK